MHALKLKNTIRLKKAVLAAVAAGALSSLALAAPAMAAPSPSSTPTQSMAQWQSAIAQVPQQGTGCYQASYPSMQWKSVGCVTAPNIPLVPAGAQKSAAHQGPATVGDGTDYSAVVSGLITKATGTFTNVSSNISEKGAIGGSGGQVANVFSLQINSQFFTGSSACSGASNPSTCQAWQQFVYTANGGGTGDLFMQYWLIGYSATCPSGWMSYSTDCYANSAAKTVSAITAKALATTHLSGTAAKGGNDVVSLTEGSGTAVSVSGKDTKVGLASHWNTAEWGVYGDGGGSAATFGASNTLEAVTTLTASSTGTPSCVKEGFTGETNNLTLAATASLGTKTSPTVGTRQTNGSPGTASCATAG